MLALSGVLSAFAGQARALTTFSDPTARDAAVAVVDAATLRPAVDFIPDEVIIVLGGGMTSTGDFARASEIWRAASS